MNRIKKIHNRFYRYIAKVMVFFFLFTTCFPILPGTPPPAYAEGEEVTYITEYTYDLNGNVKTRKTPDGDTIQYDYDSLNRLTKATYPDLSEVNYVYDANGNRIEMTDSHGTTYYAYDRFNRLTGVQFPGINPTYYEYDNANNLTKITYASGEEVNYEIADYIFY